MDEARAVYFELKPDECSLHEARIMHGARANTSDKRRAGYTMRYFPTHDKDLPGEERRATRSGWRAAWMWRGTSTRMRERPYPIST